MRTDNDIQRNDDQGVSEQWFTEMLKVRLASEWDRALRLFQKTEAELSMRVTGALLYAEEQGKVKEVLGILEREGVTDGVLDRICRETLGLRKAAS